MAGPYNSFNTSQEHWTDFLPQRSSTLQSPYPHVVLQYLHGPGMPPRHQGQRLDEQLKQVCIGSQALFQAPQDGSPGGRMCPASTLWVEILTVFSISGLVDLLQNRGLVCHRGHLPSCPTRQVQQSLRGM